MRRFYLLDVQPNLFGEWSFIREWGRTGQPGQVWAVPFSIEAEAQAALDRQRPRRSAGDTAAVAVVRIRKPVLP